MQRGEITLPAMMVRLKNTVRIQVLQNASRSVKENFKGELVVMDILKGVFNVAVTAVFCLQDFMTVGFMDLTFFNLTDCVSFNDPWGRKKAQALGKIVSSPSVCSGFLASHNPSLQSVCGGWRGEGLSREKLLCCERR